MVTIEGPNGQEPTIADSDTTQVQLPPETSEPVLQRNPCSRCGYIRPLTHRVHSDLIDQIVCEACAAEVPLASTGLGALTVERIIAIEISSSVRVAERS